MKGLCQGVGGRGSGEGGMGEKGRKSLGWGGERSRVMRVLIGAQEILSERGERVMVDLEIAEASVEMEAALAITSALFCCSHGGVVEEDFEHM